MSEIQVANAILYQVRSEFGDAPHIIQAHNWIKTNRTPFAQRVVEFDQVTSRINKILKRPVIDLDSFGNIHQLGRNLGNIRRLMTLQELTTNIYPLARKVSGGEPGLSEYVDSTFSKVCQLVKPNGEWAYLEELAADPLKMASAMLIEGYAIFLATMHNNISTRRSFVLGFEEMLFVHFPKSKLLADVIDWMREESADFSPAIQKRLRNT